MIDRRFIFFDEEKHKYSDEYGNQYTSVTTLIHSCVVPFKKYYWAKIKADEVGTSVSSIVKQWDKINKNSLDVGNKKHNAFESAIKSTSKFSKAVKVITVNDISRCFSIYDVFENPEIGELSLKEFYDKIGNKYPIIYKTIEYYVNKGYRIFSEINVYDPTNLISGTIDVLLVKDNDAVIIDWKSNRNEIKFESGYYKKDKATGELTSLWIPFKRYMIYPLDDIEDCNGSHYTLQLSLYAALAELFGLVIKGLILFHIRDSYVTNNWGMPKKDATGLYIVDKTKPEIVDHHLMEYYKEPAMRLIKHHGKSVKVSSQKILMI